MKPYIKASYVIRAMAIVHKKSKPETELIDMLFTLRNNELLKTIIWILSCEKRRRIICNFLAEINKMFHVKSLTAML